LAALGDRTDSGTLVSRRTAVSRMAGAGALAVACAIVPSIVCGAPRRRELLWGTLELNLGTPTKFIPQSAVLNHHIEAGQHFPGELKRWRELVTQTRMLRRDQQLHHVHTALQKISYRDDFALTGKRDYWASPLEFMSNGGDCEDYAIAKFRALEAAGFPASDLRIVIVRNANTSGFHAVLAAFIEGQANILDNKATAVYRQAEQTAFDPICSLDRDSLWLHWNGSDLDKRIALLRSRLNRQLA
jgi:predicted transglutaminase-like cysteine proteinase